MKQIGITGGIGSGKTYVCKLFEARGFAVYYADQEAKLLMNTDPELHAAVAAAFGKEVLLSSGEINRNYLAELVFHDHEKLNQLNAIVHPAVVRHSLQWFEHQQATSHKPFALKESALLFETGQTPLLDGVIAVLSPLALRLQRIQARDGMPLEQIRARMDKQLPEAEQRLRADYVIENDGRPLEDQVEGAIRFFS